MMLTVVILGATFPLGRLEPHGPVDPTPRCVTNAEHRTRACRCDAHNRTPLPDAARFVLHRGRCVIEGGLGPPVTEPPSPPVPPPRAGRANPSNN